jgi:hypothetical protein
MIKSNAAPQEAQTGKPEDIRPIGTSWEKILPAAPLDERSKKHRAVYTVTRHDPTDVEGVYREVIERTGWDVIEDPA